MQKWIVILCLFGGVQSQIDVGVESSSDYTNLYSSSECANWFPPKFDLEKLKVLEDFYPFRFHTNAHGSKKYKLISTHQNYPILNIKVEHGRDILKGGDLDGPYHFFRSFFVTQKDLIHTIGKERFDLEIWNVYIRNSNSSSITRKPSLNVLSMNLLFQVNNSANGSPHLQPVLSAAKTLYEKNADTSLPFNFDPYNLLPRKTDFISYESNGELPFPYPKSTADAEKFDFMKSENRSGCSAENRNFNPVKIFVSLKPLPITSGQLEMFTSVKEILNSRNKNTDLKKNTRREITYYNNNNNIRMSPKQEVDSFYYWIPNQFQVVFGRPRQRIQSRFQRSASIIDVRKNFEGKPEIDPYPSECKFMENLHDIMKRKSSHSSASLIFANMGKIKTFFLSYSVITYYVNL